MQYRDLTLTSWLDNEAGWCLFPGITVQGHPVTTFQEFFRVNRIEAFSWLISKVRRNVYSMAADFRYERVENLTHWTMLDQPEIMNQLIMDWLQKD